MTNRFDDELAEEAALDALSERWALHDGQLRRVAVEACDGYGPSVVLEVVPRDESEVSEALIRISAVTRLDVAWDASDSDFYLVAGYKALRLESGRVYISLDPFDERVRRADERDCFVIEGGTISVRFRMKL